MTATVETTELLDQTTLTSEPRYAHYADSVSVTEGYVMGKPVLALCGEFFVPSRDPLKFPVCPICQKIAEALFLASE